MLAIGFGVAVFYYYGRGIWVPVMHDIVGKRSVASVIAEYGPSARDTLRPYFERAGVPYPPANITLLAMKAEHKLELWANKGEGQIYVHTYPIKKLSGVAGPKLQEGDKQVPEGLYRLIGFNPNSAYHLSLQLNYPNAFDLTQAHQAGRTQPGSHIFIHGKALSIGCLAMGDEAIEALFVLVADVGLAHVKVVIAPYDVRIQTVDTALMQQQTWTRQLYADITRAFNEYRHER